MPLRAPGSLDSENEVERKGTVARQDKITKDAKKKAGLVKAPPEFFNFLSCFLDNEVLTFPLLFHGGIMFGDVTH